MHTQSVLKSGSFPEDSKEHTSTEYLAKPGECPIMTDLGYDSKSCTCDWREVRDLLSSNVSCVDSNNECKIIHVSGLTTKIGTYRQRKRMLDINRGRSGKALSGQEIETYKKQIAQMEHWFKQIALSLTKCWLT